MKKAVIAIVDEVVECLPDEAKHFVSDSVDTAGCDNDGDDDFHHDGNSDEDTIAGIRG